MFQLSFDGITSMSHLELCAIKIGKGSESKYFQISEDSGVKVFRTLSKAEGPYKSDTIENLYQSGMWKAAINQFRIMKFFENMDRGPKVFELLPVYSEESKCYYPAILMEHIEFDVIRRYDSETSKALIKAFLAMKRHIRDVYGGDDLHEENLVFDKRNKRFKVIDFGYFNTIMGDPQRRTSFVETNKTIFVNTLKRKSDSEKHKVIHVAGDFHMPRMDVEVNFKGIEHKMRRIDSFMEVRVNFPLMEQHCVQKIVEFGHIKLSEPEVLKPIDIAKKRRRDSLKHFETILGKKHFLNLHENRFKKAA